MSLTRSTTVDVGMSVSGGVSQSILGRRPPPQSAQSRVGALNIIEELLRKVGVSD